MRTNTTLFSLLLSSGLLFLGCTNKPSSSQEPISETTFPVTLPFETGIGTEQTVTLSQIAREVKIIPLETTDQCLLPAIIKNSITLCGHNLYIPTQKQVFQFTDEGKFVRTVARMGQGPGEYTGIRFISTDDVSKQVFLMDHGKLLAYSGNGEFMNECKFPFAWQFSALNDSTFASYIYNNTGNKLFRLLIINSKGDTLTSFPQYDRFTIPSGLNFYLWGKCDKYLYRFQNQVCMKEYYNDTVFTVRPDTLLPRYILQLGKYKLPKEKRFEVLDGNWNVYETTASNYLRPDILETPGYLFIPYTSWNVTDKSESPRLAIYDKQKGQLFGVKNGMIQNDMYGKVPFYPAMRVADDVLLYYWEASDILELAEEDPELKNIPELKDLKADDNPVIMIVRTKQVAKNL